MKSHDDPIALANVHTMPRWFFFGGVGIGAACVLAGLGLAIHGFATAGGEQLVAWLGAAGGCLIGGAGALFGTLCDWRRRVLAPQLFAYVESQPVPFFRHVFWPAIAVAAIGAACWLLDAMPNVARGFGQTAAVLAFAAGIQEGVRRHLHRQAQAIFALYADGVLEAAATAAIDAARARDARFDAAVRAHQQIAHAVAALQAPGAPPTGTTD